MTFLRSRDTLSLIGNPNLEAKYERWYWATSVVMLASPVTAIILRTIFASENAYIYFLELAGIWAFALFWFIKSHEMQTSNADLKSLRGEIGT